MTTRRDRIGRWSLGLSIALGVNLALLATLAFQVPLARRLILTEPRAMTVKLERLRRPGKTVAKPTAPVSLARPPNPVPVSTPTPPTESAPPAAQASPPAGGGNAQQGPPIAPEWADAVRAGEAMRKIRACASLFDRKQREAMGCSPGRDFDGMQVQGITAADRMAFDIEKRRAAELIETSRRMHENTLPPMGGAVRLGCRYNGEKLRCGTY